MDDMILLQELGRALGPITDESPRVLRSRVLEGIALGPARRARAAKAPRRLMFAAGLATVTAAALLIAPTLRIGGAPPPASANAAELMTAAAAAAQGAPALTARADQYVFIESIAGSMKRDAWLSVDGTHDSLLKFVYSDHSAYTQTQPGCVNGRETVPGKPGSVKPCRPVPAYLSRLPTTRSAMLDYLRQHLDGEGTADQQLFQAVGETIRDAYVPPASLAVLFDIVAGIPGIELLHGATDAAGRPGVAVQHSFGGVIDELIFDPDSHAFLGERMAVSEAGSKKLVKFDSAILKIAIVDAPGQVG